MPVIDGVFAPTTDLVQAERHVDYAAHDNHVLARRSALEAAALPVVRRLAILAADHGGFPPVRVTEQLAARLRQGLDQTARYGYRTAQAEIRSLRAGTPRAYAVPDVGEYAEMAAGGLDQIQLLIHRRSREVSQDVTEAARTAAAIPGLDKTARELAIAQAARRALHNNVLELVGESLNMGRTAGAMAMPTPPEFAMRSEQLDKTMCDVCGRLHGEIAQLGTPDYFALLPPSGCLGGGRCRGIYVFGDGPVDFRVPLPEAA